MRTALIFAGWFIITAELLAGHVECEKKCPKEECPPVATESAPSATTPEAPATAPESSLLEADTASSLDVASSPQSVAPFMIGDQSGGGCGGLLVGGLLRVTLEHPTFGCSRLNVAENNSPLPRDRVYFRYNHFVNATNTDVFSDSPGGGANSLNIDRFTFGAEKTFFGGMTSVEIRAPFSRGLTSALAVQDFQGATNLPLNDYATEFGNMNVLAKALLLQNSTWAVSLGAGVNIPTQQDVRISVNIHDDNFLLSGPGVNLPPNTTAGINADIAGIVHNQTVNLSPFIGALYTPNDRFFGQGFFQVDCPLNSSNVSMSGQGNAYRYNGSAITPESINIPSVQGSVAQQLLARVNLGVGYWLVRQPEARFLTGFAPTIECHYTGTLDNAQIVSQSVPVSIGNNTIDTSVQVGNLANQIHIVNMILGGTAEINRRLYISAGFGIPLTWGVNRPYDFEFNTFANYRFGYATRGNRVFF